MDFRRKLKINWSIWACVSIPPFVFSWLKPREVKGSIWSDWGYLVDYLVKNGYAINHDILSFFIEHLFWSALTSLLFGWIAQYLIILAWEAWRIWLSTPASKSSGVQKNGD